jgi:phosphonate transport system permease protein
MSYDDRIGQRLDSLDRAKKIRWGIAVVGLVAFFYMFHRATLVVGFSVPELIAYRHQFFAASTDYFPITFYFGVLPFLDVSQYWAFIQSEGLFGHAITTLSIAIAGTALGIPLALLFSVLGNERVLPFPFNFCFRGIMSMIRSIPALVWALIYVPLGGISPFTATLAVATDTIGNLGRLFTEELEEIDDGPIEAIDSTGASHPQTVVFGMLSQVLNPFIAWTLYILEINVRIAVTLGIIGAGGLGFVLMNQQQMFNYTEMMATIVVIFFLIITVEMISTRTRAYIRGSDADEQSFLGLVLGFPRRMVESALK